MIEYFKLIFPKLFKAFGICFLLFSVIILILMTALAISKDLMDEFLSAKALVYIILFPACLSLFIMLIAFISEYFKLNSQRQAFQRLPFSKLHEIGFTKIELLKNSIWTLYKETYYARINGYHVLADMLDKKRITFTLLADSNPRMKFPLPEKYREGEVFCNDTGMVITIPVESYWTPGIQEINELLRAVSKMMGETNINPASDLSIYERKMIRDMVMRGLGAGAGVS